MSDKDTPLHVTVVDGCVRIEIGTRTLARAVACSPWATPYDENRGDFFRTFAIADIEQFAKDVVSAMRDEREDGSSLLTDLLDKSAQEAIEQGSEALADADDVLIAFNAFHDQYEGWAAHP